jgi:hypothetical protein
MRVRKSSHADTEERQHYVFIANFVEWEPHTRSPEIITTLVGNGVWLASPNTPYRRDYKKGDRALFYAAGPGARCFLADAVIAGPLSENTPKEAALARKLGLEGIDERIPLEAQRLWQRGVPLPPLVEELAWIKDKKNYGLNLRQAAARVPSEDFDRILNRADLGK